MLFGRIEARSTENTTSSKTQVRDTKTKKSASSMDVSELSDRIETSRSWWNLWGFWRQQNVPESPGPVDPPAWWNLWGLWKQQRSRVKVHPESQSTAEMDCGTSSTAQPEAENPKEVLVSLVEDVEGNLEVNCDADVLMNQPKILEPPQQSDRLVNSDPSKVDMQTKSIKTKTPLESQTFHRRVPVQDTWEDPRPPSRKHGFPEVAKHSSETRTPLKPDVQGRINNNFRYIPIELSRRYGSLDLPRDRILQESLENRLSLLPDKTSQKIRVRHATPKRKVCRTGDPAGRPWRPGQIPHFDLRAACSRETFERVMFIRADFKMTPSQEKITDMGEFIAAKKEYLRIKSGGKVKTVDTLHVSKLETKGSHEDPNLFGEDAWPLPQRSEHAPPTVSSSLRGNMSGRSFEHRLIPVLEREFGYTIEDPDPLPSVWQNFKNAFKMGGNRSSAEPKKPLIPKTSPSEPSTSWFGTIKRKWTKLVGRKKEEEEGEEFEVILSPAESIRSVRKSLLRVKSVPETGKNSRHSRVQNREQIRHEVKVLTKENSQGTKDGNENDNSKRRYYRKGKTPITPETNPTSQNSQSVAPKNYNPVPRRQLSTLSHGRPN